MDVTADFECGAAVRLANLAENHWRLEAQGDPSGYDKYFCVRVTNDSDAPALLRLDVHPDADLGEPGAAFFASHFPSNIFCCGDQWTAWHPLRNTWEDSVTFDDRHFELRVPIAPASHLYIATNPVRRYSDHLAWIDAMRAKHGDRLQAGVLGKSAEGRDLPLLRLGRPGAPKFLVLAGQHPSEHCGNWASEGIVEYLLSSLTEAREIAAGFDFAVVPMINPDGNVHGLSGANAEGVNLFSDFAGAAAGAVPKTTENRALWDFLSADFPPDVVLHFHGYMGWKTFCTPPYDGVYFLRDAEALYPAPDKLSAYRRIGDRLIFDTHACTAAWGGGLLVEENLEHQLALKFGTLSAFYEVNSASVGAFDQFRRGPQVLAAVAAALMRDAGGLPGA
jgi:hypothetical protein